MRPKCVAAPLLSEVQCVVQFHRTAAASQLSPKSCVTKRSVITVLRCRQQIGLVSQGVWSGSFKTFYWGKNPTNLCYTKPNNPWYTILKWLLICRFKFLTFDHGGLVASCLFPKLILDQQWNWTYMTLDKIPKKCTVFQCGLNCSIIHRFDLLFWFKYSQLNIISGPPKQLAYSAILQVSLSRFC